jgi:two-component system sensor histidine kinase PilS (NtrC family)
LLFRHGHHRRLLARRVVTNENAGRVSAAGQLDDQLRISERIIRDMEDGVLVVDSDGRVRLLNPRAGGDAGFGRLGRPRAAELTRLSRERPSVTGSWGSNSLSKMVEMLRQEGGRLVRVRYLPSAESGGHALIYLEDMERVQSQAQQLKLAALGRLYGQHGARDTQSAGCDQSRRRTAGRRRRRSMHQRLAASSMTIPATPEQVW